MRDTGSANYVDLIKKSLGLQERLIEEVKKGKEIMVVDIKATLLLISHTVPVNTVFLMMMQYKLF